MTKNNKNQELEALFFHPKPARLLTYIKSEKEPYASVLAKRIDATYAHTIKLLQKMRALELIEFKKEGRKKPITLTNFGSDLADEFDLLLNRRMNRVETETTPKT